MLKNYNTYTSAKKNSTDISNGFISDITRKVEKEPAWLKDISKNLIYESEVAGKSGIESRIAEANKRLESFSIDLDGFNNMPSDRKGKSHIVEFTKERYKPLVTEETHKMDLTIPQNKYNTEKSSLGAGLNTRLFGSGKKDNFKTEAIPSQNADSREGLSNYQTMVYKGKGDQQTAVNSAKYSEAVTPDIDKAKKIAVAGGGSLAVYTGYVADYNTDENDDFSKTYGTSIKREKNSQLGYDSLQSRAFGTVTLYNNRTILKNASDRYGVPVEIMGACVFTEQSCNVTGIEDLTDTLKFAKEQNASFGIGQVSIKAAKLVEEEDIIIEPIKFVKIDKAGLVWWDVPGVGVMNGTFEEALRERLKIPEQNAEYMAAYLKYQRNIWYRQTGIDLMQRPDVWLTLYNIHLGDNGFHSNPQPNDFGRFGRANMYYVGSIINMP